MTDTMARGVLAEGGPIASFEGYRGTLSDYSKMTPHAQGIVDPGVFEDIIESPDTLLAVDQGAIVPGLHRIDGADWFNVAHIRKVTSAQDVMALHGTPALAELELTEEAKKDASLFLLGGGLVVVSNPDADAAAHDSAERLLDGLVRPLGFGLEYVELGNQTYFEGEAIPINTAQWEEERSALRAQYLTNPAEMIAGAFYNKAPADGRSGIRVRSYTQVPSRLTGGIYKFVGDAFDKISEHPCRQAWTQEEFREIVEDKKSVVKVVSEKDGKAAALLAFGVNLDDFPWVNKDYWTDEERNSGKNVYFPTAASNPRAVGVLALSQSINYMSEVFGAAGPGIKIYFDSCDRNREILPRKIEAAVSGSKTHSLEFREIASQNYGAFRIAQ